MTTPVPFDVFSSELLPEERIQWTGQPNPTVLFHPEDSLAIPFSLLWGGFSIFWLLGASGIWDIWRHNESNSLEYSGLIFGIPFVLIGQYLIQGRFVYSHWKKRRTYYALTDRRALIVHGGITGHMSSSAYFENLSLIDKRVRSDGIGSISFGGPVTGQWRWQGEGEGNPPPRPPTFDDINDADTVYQIAIRLHDQAQKSALVSSSR